jgi:Uri superfamily endonuclease
MGVTDAALQAISYQLLIEITRPLRRRVGGLGMIYLPAGRYVYTGSATRGLEARIARHLRRRKPLRWHIDYLTTAPGVRILDVLRSALPECRLNQSTRGELPIAGFGASDCTAGCGAHLRRVD